MSCNRPLLALYLSGRLQGLDQFLEIQLHLDSCPRCWEVVYQAAKGKGIPLYSVGALEAEEVVQLDHVEKIGSENADHCLSPETPLRDCEPQAGPPGQAEVIDEVTEETEDETMRAKNETVKLIDNEMHGRLLGLIRDRIGELKAARQDAENELGAINDQLTQCEEDLATLQQLKAEKKETAETETATPRKRRNLRAVATEDLKWASEILEALANGPLSRKDILTRVGHEHPELLELRAPEKTIEKALVRLVKRDAVVWNRISARLSTFSLPAQKTA